jgi:hypothetical protein
MRVERVVDEFEEMSDEELREVAQLKMLEFSQGEDRPATAKNKAPKGVTTAKPLRQLH